MGNSRKYSLDVLRIIATLLIVFHHYQQFTDSFFEGYLNFYNGKFYFGYLVEFFFVLSGLFMFRYIRYINPGCFELSDDENSGANQHHDMSFKQFFVGRAIRLLPLVMISSIVYEIIAFYYHTIVFGKTWNEVPINIWGVILNSLGIQAGWAFYNPGINNPAWYVSVLLLCYLMFYLVTFISRRITISPIYMYIFMVVLGCGITNYDIKLPFFNGLSARGYYAFFFGLLLAWILNSKKVTVKDFSLSCITVVGVLLLVKYRYEWVESELKYIMTFLFYPALIIIFSFQPFAKIFEIRAIGFFAKVTYGVYLWHTPCLLLLKTVFVKFNIGINYHTPRMMLLFAILQFFIGTASYLAIEMPVATLVKKVLSTNN